MCKEKPVALYYSILKYQADNYQRLNQDFDLIELPDPSHDTEAILNKIDVLFAPLGYFVNKEKIDLCNNLKVIASNTTGHPHIDVEYARKKGVKVACLKFAQAFLQRITPTAELTWGLIIALTRNIVPAYSFAIEGNWDRRPFGARAMLSSMSIGIVGLGRLGSIVAKYSSVFDMDIYYYDPYVESSDKNLQRCKTLGDLVATVDIITIHVPHNSETELMFNDKVFKLFKPGAYLVNTARGELIAWDSLLQALRSGALAGAALDVFEGEFSVNFEKHFKVHPVLEYAKENDNLLLTPHIGGSTIDAWGMTEAYTIDMVEEALSGGEIS